MNQSTSPSLSAESLVPGTRVRVTQQIQNTSWRATLEGAVVRYEQSKTGSWFAHAKDDRLWLDRLIVEKEDGEIVVCNLDAYTHIETVR